MKKLHGLIFIFLTPVLLCWSQMKKEAPPEKLNIFFWNTNDDFIWKDERFLLNKSPLSTFAGYKNIFPRIGRFVIDYESGTSGRPEKNYSAKWILIDSTLFLSNVILDIPNNMEKSIDDYYPQNESYKIVEYLTGIRFGKKYMANTISQPITPLGIMPALWVTDTLVIKRARKFPKETIEKWNESPYYKLIFERGKLLSAQKIGKDPKKNISLNKQQMHL